MKDTWEILRSDIDNCKRCNLCIKNGGYAFSSGNPKSRLMFIGIAAGKDEILGREPFTGQAGKLLEQRFQAIGLSRDFVYLANVVKARPFEISEHGNERNIDPSEEEINACLPFLERQIQLVNPSFIICLGAIPSKALIKPDFKITKERGILYEKTSIGIPAMAMMHPAWLLRQKNVQYDNAIIQYDRDLRKSIEYTKKYVANPLGVFDE